MSLKKTSKIVFAIVLFHLAAGKVHAESLVVNITQDTYAEEYYPTTSPWNNKNFYAGKDVYYGKGRTRPFVKFDAVEIVQKGIEAEDIESASLNLYQYDNQDNKDYTFKVYKVDSAWTQENLSWVNQPSFMHLDTEVSMSRNNGWKNIDITELTKKLIEDPFINNGLGLRLSKENNKSKIFWSSACYNAPTPPSCSNGQQPFVKIDYTPNAPPLKPDLITPQNNYFTNNPEIIFRANPVVDPNGEKVVYSLQISKGQEFEDFVHKSDWKLLPFFSETLEPNQTYFWRIVAKDEHRYGNNTSVSDSRSFIVDISPPTVPTISTEPPYTNGAQNEIMWENSLDNISDQITYQAEISLDINFTTIKEKSGWLHNNNFTFNNLEDGKKYFYRARSKDEAGNISDYSEITSSTQDLHPPQVENFNATPRIISPNNNTSKGVADVTEISADISDPTLKKVDVIITNSYHDEIFRYQYDYSDTFGHIRTDSDIHNVRISWPQNIKTHGDGKYFVYLEAEDLLGNEKHSESIIFEIDNKSPAKPKIKSPTNGSITNKDFVSLKAESENNTRTYIFLNNKLQRKKSSRNIDIVLDLEKEGLNNIKLQTFDEAGNNSSSNVDITRDTHKPNKPTFEIEPNESQKSIYLKISGEQNTTVEVYSNSKLIKTFYLKEKNQRFLAIKNWKDSHTYDFYVSLTDRAGNRSEFSSKKSYTTPAPPQQGEIIGIGTGTENKIEYPKSIPPSPVCKVEVHEDKESFRVTSCDFPNPKLSDVVNYGKQNNKYWMFKLYGGAQNEADIKINHIRCKSRNFWDPRTWFGCVDQKYKTSTQRLNFYFNFIPKIEDHSSRIDVYDFNFTEKQNFGSELYTYEDPEEKKVSAKLYLKSFIKISDIWVDITDTTGYSNSLKIPTDSKSTEKMGFMFRRYVGVTQWHGCTAYQCPHKGIDFGVVKEPIYSPADGVVKAVGWDNYYGKCYSGGYFIRVEHTNRMNSVYFHLNDIKDSSGKTLKSGAKISRGQRIATSGNTGAWNCKSLGYHLHFELRKNRHQDSHVNPVPYIAVDWNKIPTLNWRTNPGRLSGDNPHPNF